MQQTAKFLSGKLAKNGIEMSAIYIQNAADLLRVLSRESVRNRPGAKKRYHKQKG